jgi:RNA polymerase sigma-70 factor, ECF subfamily
VVGWTVVGTADAVAAETFEQLRPLLFGIAYRMLGSVADAEDIVQEAFLRYHRALASSPAVESPKAFLSAVVTRLAIDQLRSARVRREAYIGPWLPEPVLTDPVAPGPAAAGPAEQAEHHESLSMAFLLLLERLSPAERAVFLLRDVFGFGYGEIAGIVGLTEANCRQVAHRARQHVTEHKPRFDASARQRDDLARRFFAIVEGDADLSGLVGLLAEDVTVYGDSGGTKPSWPQPIHGRDNVLRLVAGLVRQGSVLGATSRRVQINGQPGALFYDRAGRLISAMVLDISDGAIAAVRSIIAPGKLGHLGPLSDFRNELDAARHDQGWRPQG